MTSASPSALSAAFTRIRLDVSDGVAVVTLARPERLNAFDAAMHGELRAALDRAENDPEIAVLVLTGEGRAFSSGQDLTEDLPRDPRGRIDLGPPLEGDYNPLVLRLSRFPKPTIAGLNGPAVGAAANIALACDLVIAARSATIHQAFVRIGLIPDAGGTWFLPRLAGAKRAAAMMMLGDPVSADEALSMGLVGRVVDDADFPAALRDLALRIARGPRLAQRLVKEALAASLDNSLEDQLALEAELQRRAGFSEDFVEGVAAFREKRKPRFTER